jgi:2-C-methyl-D-erythritol 4-phosphate cytidylyltransferase
MHRVGLVIAAGGKGRRAGGRLPKQFQLMGRRSILELTIRRFHSFSFIHEIVVVVPGDHVGRVRDMIRRRRFSRVTAVVPGGRERQHSVWEGLNAFSRRPDQVLVHDAVRPFVDRSSVEAVVRAARRYGAAVVGTRVKDTVKFEGRPGYYTRTLPRERLWAVQTPQGFDFGLLMRAYRAARKKRFLGTDDASLVEHQGVNVRIVKGNDNNMKITTSRDLVLARILQKFRGVP